MITADTPTHHPIPTADPWTDEITVLQNRGPGALYISQRYTQRDWGWLNMWLKSDEEERAMALDDGLPPRTRLENIYRRPWTLQMTDADLAQVRAEETAE